MLSLTHNIWGQRYLFGYHSERGEQSVTNPFEDDDAEYMVLVNSELQYSLWPGFKEVPAGWTPVGPRGKRQECLAWIEETWTDMRPKSLVDAMEVDKKSRQTVAH
jgi:uncharacterized protein YbdZ (MbtH family)